MFLKTFKGRILAVSLGMTIVSVTIFGYGLASIYYQHMEKCLSRSLSFLTNIITHEYDLSHWSPQMEGEIRKNEQMQSILKGGLLEDLRIEMVSAEPVSVEDRLSRSSLLSDGRYLVISSSTAKIDDELINMMASRWFFFLLGFLFTSGLIYVLIRLLFAPFNELVNHCLTCDDPDNKPDAVSGGTEIVALRDAIATLQQRISGLQKAQHDSMKALTHELKTPLAQLRLRIDIADQKGEWNADAIVQAREEIDTIAEKITHILHATQQSEEMETIYLKESVERWIEELKPLWQHRELHFELNIPEASAALLPKKPFERVARILIENALNHTCLGSTIYLRCDNGTFEINNPVCGQSTPIIHSAGVGLEIAKTLCDYYGWHLSDVQDEKQYRVTLSLGA
ncbi:MAG TPA: HAMP domain-containing sensor histidine kinase [Sulfuricurvum sp.]|nr:HAMP domain-containing sensor histidine kinase [Sulfuricurvum sp.]